MCKSRVRQAAGIAKHIVPLALVGEAGWVFVHNVSDRVICQDSALTGARYTLEPDNVRLVDVRDLQRLTGYKVNGKSVLVQVNRDAL